MRLMLQRIFIITALLSGALFADLITQDKAQETELPAAASYVQKTAAGFQMGQGLDLRIEPKHSPQVPLCPQSKESSFSDYHCLLVFSGVYYGILLLLFLYNLLAFAQTHSRSHLFYLVFLGSFALTKLSFDGVGRVLLWSDLNWVIMQGQGILVGAMIISFFLFSRSFLKTGAYTPKIDRLLFLMLLLLCVLTFSAIFFSISVVIVMMGVISLVLLPFFLFLGIKAYANKFYSARFYSAGIGSFSVLGLVLAMDSYGWIEDFYALLYAQQLTSALGMIFLSCALADRLKKSEQEDLEKVNTLNRHLQEKVDKTLSQLRRNNHALIERSHLAAMGEKIEQIAHQWRQPLHALALINQNLYFKTQLNTVTKEDYEEVHDKMNEQLQYMSQTIDDFRNFSKSNKKKEAFFVETVIKSAISLSEGSLEQANIKTQLISKGEHTAYGMCHELMQVFMNLIKNAQDVILEKNIQDPWIRFSVTEQQNQTKICVEDNAGGIPAEALKRVFQPYFTTKNSSGGSGIGLYMSKEIIEKSLLGQISVTNSEKGALFTVLLPKTTKEVRKN